MVRSTPQDEASGQVDIWSDLGQVELWSDLSPRMRLLVRLTFGQTWVKLNFGQMYPQDEASIQVNIWSAFGQIDLW